MKIPLMMSAREVDASKDRGDGYEASTQHRLPPMASCVRPRLIHAVDAAIAMFVLIAIVLIEIGVFPSAQRGFWCNDPSISYRFRGDSVTNLTLFVVTLLSPIVLMFLAEHWAASGCGFSRVKVSLWQTLCRFGDYIFGLIFMLFIIEIMKAIVGEPRPHFMDTCRPEPGSNCTYGTYITNYECTNAHASTWSKRESARSFPSGHAGLGCYTGIFMMWYLHSRARHYWGSMFVTPLVQALYVCYAISCSVTRITDHRHHWWDVIVGALIGTAGAVFAVRCLSRRLTSSCADGKEVRHTKLVGVEVSGNTIIQNGGNDRDDRTRHHQSARRLLSDMSHAEDTPVAGHQLA